MVTGRWTSRPFTRIGLANASWPVLETAAIAHHCFPLRPYTVSVKSLEVLRSLPVYVVWETGFFMEKGAVPVPVPVLPNT